MKWILVLALLLGATVAGGAALARPETSCPGGVVDESAGRGHRDAWSASPRAALGDRWRAAAVVRAERNDDKGFTTVAFRGYDADEQLLGLVVVEERRGSWRVARVESCVP